MALKDIYIPQTLKNAPLSPEQQQGLREGKAIWIEGMDKKVKQGEQPEKISRFVQYNAANKNFDFKFSDEQRQQFNQERSNRQGELQEQKIPKARKLGEIWVYSKQAGVQLSHEDFNKLCNKEPVFVEGMQTKPKQQEQATDASGSQKVEATDQQGQKYNAWVWITRAKARYAIAVNIPIKYGLSRRNRRRKADKTSNLPPRVKHKRRSITRARPTKRPSTPPSH